MTVYLVLNSFIEILLIATVYFLWRKTKQPSPQMEANASVEVAPPELIEAWKKEFETLKVGFQEKLTTLNVICEGARRILNEGNGVSANVVGTASDFRPILSREAEELKEVVKATAKKIPSLEHLEATKERLKRDLPLDLKTILKDQLA